MSGRGCSGSAAVTSGAACATLGAAFQCGSDGRGDFSLLSSVWGAGCALHLTAAPFESTLGERRELS
jgi:hypothetical protein